MKITLPFHPAILLAAVALAGTTGLQAEENSATAKFSNPAKPGTLKVILTRGDVHITGSDGADVIVNSEAQPQDRPRKDGLRVLTESSSYALSEKDNVITLDAGSDGWMGGDSDYKITVPRGTNVVVSNSLGGDISCGGVTGDIEIKSLHGEVELNDISGSAVVETMNGEINATVRELHEGKALSFQSMNGEVAVRVPATAKANVRLRTQNGTIATDFDKSVLVTKVENVGGMHRHDRAVITADMKQAFREAARASKIAGEQVAAAMREAAEAAREGLEDDNGSADKDATKAPRAVAPVPPIPPVPPISPAIPTLTGGKLVTGTLNGGGPEIAVTTMNGDVTLRQVEKK